MFSIRHHIASLVAVFVALGLGMLIGGVLTESGDVERYHDKLVSRLEDEFQELRQENIRLQSEAEELRERHVRQQEYLTTVIRILAEGVLDERSVHFFSSLEEGKGLEEAVDMLSLAGAEIQLLNFQELKDGEIDCDTAVVYLSPQLAAQERKELCDRLDSEQYRVIAVQPQKMDAEALAPFQQRGVTTIDNVDTPFGRFALLVAIKGAEGNFGTDKGAESLLPEVEEVRKK